MCNYEPIGRVTSEKYEQWLAVQHRNAVWERQKLEIERERRKAYKQSMIEDILRWAGDKWTCEELQKASVGTLERIYDNC